MPKKKVEVVDETVSLALALKELCQEKGLPESVVKDAVAEALKKAYFKFSDDYPDTIINVDIDLDDGRIEMYKIKNVVEEIQDDVFETDPEEAYEATGIHYQVGDTIKTPIDISSFRRAAAMQAKNVFKQKLREAEKSIVVERFQNKVGHILTGVVEAIETKHCIVKIGGNGGTNAYLNRSNMLPGESFRQGQIVKVYVEEVDKAAAGAPIIVSRTNAKFVTRLMEEEIGEIKDGTVEIKGVSRQPGSRSKVAVVSKDPNVDPSGACIGPHGSRIARVIANLNNEKIDVVNYDENPLLFVADSLKPALVVGIQMVDEEQKQIRAIVPDEQFSLAIGKDAQNVNLAVRLTGYKIDIKSVSDAEEQGLEYQNIEDVKTMEMAKRARGTSTVTRPRPVADTYVAPVSNPLPTYENKVEETPVENTNKEVETPVTPATPKVEEEVKVRPTKSKTPNVFSELEAALNATSSTQEEAKPQKKKKKFVKDEDTFEEELPATPKKQTPSNVLPVYTEEELRALEEEEAEENSKYDEDIDYDEFDEYYDDED